MVIAPTTSKQLSEVLVDDLKYLQVKVVDVQNCERDNISSFRIASPDGRHSVCRVAIRDQVAVITPTVEGTDLRRTVKVPYRDNFEDFSESVALKITKLILRSRFTWATQLHG